METMSSSASHVVFVPLALRSHFRIMLQLSLNLLSLHPTLLATLLVTRYMVHMMDEEVALQSDTLSGALASRFDIHVIEDDLPAGSTVFAEKLAFKARCEKSISVLLTGEGTKYLPARAFISDMHRTTLRKQVHSVCERLGQRHVPVLHLMPSMALTMHRFVASAADGGWCEGITERMAAHKADGMSDNEAAFEAYRNVQNRLLEWTDLPPMYDYEYSKFADISFSPSRADGKDSPNPGPMADTRVITPGSVVVQKLVFTVSRHTDGIICNGVPEIDGASLRRIEQMLTVPCYGVNDEVWSAAQETTSHGPADQDVMTFLDEAFEKYGPDSLGTIFWPVLRPEIVETILDSLLELERPMLFVFATAGKDARVSDEIRAKVRDSGKGMIVDWVPQMKVLQHEATGVFLTHCGWGSLMEAIIAGVPIITLPFAMDQPALSAYFTQIQPVGIQLQHMSSLNDGLPLGSGTVVDSSRDSMLAELKDAWERMRGSEGAAYRVRMGAVLEIMRQSWENGGSRQAMEELGRMLLATGAVL
ncbi:hypothetical protein P7C73_g5563, partial [Tremellales sp. Uapishka_1]